MGHERISLRVQAAEMGFLRRVAGVSLLVGVVLVAGPQANVKEAQLMLADQILSAEQANPDSLVIVLGNFNKGNLSHELPK